MLAGSVRHIKTIFELQVADKVLNATVFYLNDVFSTQILVVPGDDLLSILK